MPIVNRRTVLASVSALTLGSIGSPAVATKPPAISFTYSAKSKQRSFDPNNFNIVGIYDFDWLFATEFERMLDLIASSPGAIGGVRSFGIFTMGEREALKPGTGGVVWSDPADTPDFTLPLAALEALIQRNLIPFISLGFFPPAVSKDSIDPPASFENWQQLVRLFLEALISDERFGAESIASWWFEVWNEPNEGRFWSGTFDQYLELYRATSEVVSELGLTIRLGGPAMAYKPESEAEDGPETMSKFLMFLRDDPSLKCDFISYHRKGTVDSSAPDPARLRNAALGISDLIDKIVPERAEGLILINNEADEKIGFETPYLPRMDSFAASWLTTLVTTHTGLGSAQNRRFVAVQDNANLQLMQTPFDGRRSIFSFLSSSDKSDLVKTCGAVWYDLLPILRGQVVISDSPNLLFPNTEIHMLSTRDDHGIALLVTWHPIEPPVVSSNDIVVELRDVPWETVNLAQWKIDAEESNAFAAHQAYVQERPIDVDAASAVRARQELSLVSPRGQPVTIANGTLKQALSLNPYDTLMLWWTPVLKEAVPNPAEARKRATENGVEISWAPVSHEQLLGYELRLRTHIIGNVIRPCSRIDSPSTIDQQYSVRAVSASGMYSDWVEAVR